MVGSPLDFLLSGPPEFEPFDPAGKSLVIEELRVAQPRVITMFGRALPTGSLNFGGSQRGEVTMYPGNPVGTVQVLGPSEGESECSGTWKDRFLGGAVAVEGGGEPKRYALAQELVQLFHSIRRSGVALRVQYMDEVRFGWLSEFEANWLRATDVEWTMTFSWYAWGDDQVPRMISSAAEPPKKLLGWLGDLIAVVAAAPGILRNLQAIAVTAVNNIVDTTKSLVSALEAIDELTDFPGTLVGAVLADVRALDRQLSDLISRIGDVATPVIADAPNVSGPITDPVTRRKASQFTNSVLAESWKRDVAAAAARLRDASESAVNARMESLVPRATRVVEISSKSSLYDLAIQFYGSADFAGFIAASNSLGSAIVPAGTKIRILPKPASPNGYPVKSSGGRC